MSEPIGLFLNDTPHEEQLPLLPEQSSLPDAYRLPAGTVRGPIATTAPLYLGCRLTTVEAVPDDTEFLEVAVLSEDYV
jgi:hypothetical protein